MDTTKDYEYIHTFIYWTQFPIWGFAVINRITKLTIYKITRAKSIYKTYSRKSSDKLHLNYIEIAY